MPLWDCELHAWDHLLLSPWLSALLEGGTWGAHGGWGRGSPQAIQRAGPSGTPFSSAAQVLGNWDWGEYMTPGPAVLTPTSVSLGPVTHSCEPRVGVLCPGAQEPHCSGRQLQSLGVGRPGTPCRDPLQADIPGSFLVLPSQPWEPPCRSPALASLSCAQIKELFLLSVLVGPVPPVP